MRRVPPRSATNGVQRGVGRSRRARIAPPRLRADRRRRHQVSARVGAGHDPLSALQLARDEQRRRNFGRFAATAKVRKAQPSAMTRRHDADADRPGDLDGEVVVLEPNEEERVEQLAVGEMERAALQHEHDRRGGAEDRGQHEQPRRRAVAWLPAAPIADDREQQDGVG